MEKFTIASQDTLGTIQVHTPPANSWFFKHMATGEFVWNPELIKAFVKQMGEEVVKQAKDSIEKEKLL